MCHRHCPVYGTSVHTQLIFCACRWLGKPPVHEQMCHRAFAGPKAKLRICTCTGAGRKKPNSQAKKRWKSYLTVEINDFVKNIKSICKRGRGRRRQGSMTWALGWRSACSMKNKHLLLRWRMKTNRHKIKDWYDSEYPALQRIYKTHKMYSSCPPCLPLQKLKAPSSVCHSVLVNKRVQSAMKSCHCDEPNL